MTGLLIYWHLFEGFVSLHDDQLGNSEHRLKTPRLVLFKKSKIRFIKLQKNISTNIKIICLINVMTVKKTSQMKSSMIKM